MINKTNLALGIGIALYFLPHVSNKFIFFPIVLIACLIPDIQYLLPGKKVIYADRTGIFKKILQTYLTPIIISAIFAFYYPIFALPFFLGYSFTLTLNSFSKEGIHPFWPISKKKTDGKITSGGKIDSALFYIFLLFDVALLIKLFI